MILEFWEMPSRCLYVIFMHVCLCVWAGGMSRPNTVRRFTSTTLSLTSFLFRVLGDYKYVLIASRNTVYVYYLVFFNKNT